MKKCKWCNGTGREQPQKEEHQEINIHGLRFGGFKNATKCKKCHGKGFIIK